MKADSDLEESSDCSDSDARVRFSHGLTRSVFNITFDSLENKIIPNNESTDYQKRLNSEIDEWCSLLKNIKQTVSNHSCEVKNVDYSVLPAEKLAYLKLAPGLSEFIDESIEFRKEANAYMEEYAEILEMHENLTELCQDRLDNQKSVLVEKYIFNNPKSSRKIN